MILFYSCSNLLLNNFSETFLLQLLELSDPEFLFGSFYFHSYRYLHLVLASFLIPFSSLFMVSINFLEIFGTVDLRILLTKFSVWVFSGIIFVNLFIFPLWVYYAFLCLSVLCENWSFWILKYVTLGIYFPQDLLLLIIGRWNYLFSDFSKLLL